MPSLPARGFFQNKASACPVKSPESSLIPLETMFFGELNDAALCLSTRRPSSLARSRVATAVAMRHVDAASRRHMPPSTPLPP